MTSRSTPPPDGCGFRPRDPEFFSIPIPPIAAIRAAAPVFFWEDYGFWCFARHADVSALLRDRRFGRQILHVATARSLGWPEPPAHLEPFDAIERHSLLELEPPEHTRLRGLVNRAFVSRQVERLAPRIAALAHELIDGFERRGEADLIAAFATPIPVAVIAELIGAPSEMAPQLLDWSHRMVAMYQFGVDPRRSRTRRPRRPRRIRRLRARSHRRAAPRAARRSRSAA